MLSFFYSVKTVTHKIIYFYQPLKKSTIFPPPVRDQYNERQYIQTQLTYSEADGPGSTATHHTQPEEVHI